MRRPVAERLRVVGAEALHVLRLEPGALERELDPRQVQRRGVREHVALRERARLGIAHAQPRDAVVQHPPAGLHESRHLARVDVDLVGAHVLDHPDARHRVERLAGEVAVVHHPDVHAVREAALLGAPARERGLGLRQRDSHHVHTVVRGGVEREAAPAAADVEHALAGLSASFVQTSSSFASWASSSVVAPARTARSCRSSTRPG